MSNKQLFNLNSNSRKLQSLTDKAKEASDAYYNGSPIMSDHEFDELVSELKEVEDIENTVLPGSPTHSVGAPVSGSLPKFKHPYPALSLDKTKSVDELISKFSKGIQQSGSNNDNIVVMYKEDGSTVQAYYVAGKLDKLVTRGNGEIGSVITHNADVLSGLPKNLKYKIDIVVRGEATMSYSEFNRINDQIGSDQQYANPRNLASATLTMIDTKEASERKLMFQAFNLVHLNTYFLEPIDSDERFGRTLDDWSEAKQKFSSRLKLLSELGFNVVPYNTCSIDSVRDCISQMTDNVPRYDYPVDGLVLAMDNFEYASTLAGTEHHPNIMQGYAFKWADETKETILREIEWSPSRTGLLNPVAIFDPVELEGTIVKRASLHNLSIMRKMRIHIGDKLSVLKSNMIIPFVDKNLDYDNEQDYTDEYIYDLIGCCPTCRTKALVKRSEDGIETVYCPNEECPEKMIGRFVHFCSRDCMNIQGMSEETIKKLVDAGFIKKYSDFFRLSDHPEIAQMSGFGEVSWNNMCKSAEAAKTTDFVNFITSLSIPNIGKGQAKVLRNYLCDNYALLAEKAGIDPKGFNLCVLLSNLGKIDFDFSVIDGFGDVLADSLLTWIKLHFQLEFSASISPELSVFGYLTFTDKPKSNIITLSSISGKSFCITGKLVNYSNRQELVDKIESLGGKWIDSVSSKTDYLINNDVKSTSGKNKKAKELNIPIISESDFEELIK